ncbi:MAG: hypothetical protein M1821_008667 [Bathelium mastoideum]|nr:MAG: hypothetical protein M1821_008667 [Bathelium mastoideum]
MDNRFPSNATGASVDAGLLPFNSQYDLGQGQTWAQDLQFPSVSRSLFDGSDDKAVEVTISDKSVFLGTQTGFRRTELLPQRIPGDASTDPLVNTTTSGVKTFHLSIMRDETRALNYSHEYYLSWLESADFSRDQFTVGTGTLFGNGDNVTTSQAAQVLWVRSNDVNAAAQTTLWQTPFTTGIWHNLGLTLNFDQNTVQIYYSSNNASLTSQGPAVSNDLSGNGSFHVGLLKKPTGLGLTDITTQGFQESGINEGMIFGGVFEEDSSSGCVSLSSLN